MIRPQYQLCAWKKIDIITTLAIAWRIMSRPSRVDIALGFRPRACSAAWEKRALVSSISVTLNVTLRFVNNFTLR